MQSLAKLIPIMAMQEKFISDLTAGHKSIEYEARDIALYDIRVNADNEIFRQADTQEDIVQLAEDIQRNGLMHNLVVFPQEENGKSSVCPSLR